MSRANRRPSKRIKQPLSSAIWQHVLEYCLDRVRRNPKVSKSGHIRFDQLSDGSRQQRLSEAKLMAIGVSQMKEALTPFGITRFSRRLKFRKTVLPTEMSNAASKALSTTRFACHHLWEKR
jgi:hypothetical protein